MAAVEIGQGGGHVQAGWQETDERIRFGFIRALRRGDYDAALRMAPTAEGMADWPAGQRADWVAWIELAHLMKGQRDHERRQKRHRRP